MSRAAKNARRKKRRNKVVNSSFDERQANRERKYTQEMADREAHQAKLNACVYHSVELSPEPNQQHETIYYAEGAEQALILWYWVNEGWKIWMLTCQVCNETWPHYQHVSHP